VLLSIALFFLMEPTAVQSRTGSVEGRLLLKEGSPASGVRVSAVVATDAKQVEEFSGSTIVTSAITDGSGHYSLEEVPPGRYYITAGLIEFPTYYPGVRDARDGQVISVAPGSMASGIDFAMVIPLGVRISGRVADWPGRSVGALPIQLVLRSSRSAAMHVGDIKPDGSFEFLHVPPGPYTLSAPVSAPVPQAGPASRSVPMNGAALGLPQFISVLDRDITGLIMQLPVLVTGHVMVIVEGGANVPTFSLLFTGASGRQTFTIQPDGKFSVGLPQGEYRVTLTALPAAYYLKSIVSGKASLLGEPVKLSGGPVEIVVTLGVHPENGVRP
jgi:hypothetical protein